MTIVTTVLTMCGVSGLLAFLLSLANKTIANYGDKEISINEGTKTLTVDGGDTLLSALVEQKVFIPSACGGKGSCGYCKVQVLSGGGQILPTELGYITKDEQADHYRLACQLKVKDNLSIQIPEELFSVQQMTYVVEDLIEETPTIKHLKLKLPEGEALNFKAGQYVQILAPKYEGNEEEVYRAYSIASSPMDFNHLELYIGLVKGGIATTFVHNFLKPNQKLTVVGPYGHFFYQDTDAPMVLVAIGTGMAPIMSILKYMRDMKIMRKAIFFFGARTRDDLFEIDALNALKTDLPNLTIMPCLSRPTEQCHWDGEVGRVTDLLHKYLTEAEKSEAYLCGSPVMIDAVIPILKEKGMPEDKIYYDKFE